MVKSAIRIYTGNEHSRRTRLSLMDNRQQNRTCGRIVPFPFWNLGDAFREILHQHRFAVLNHPLERPDALIAEFDRIRGSRMAAFDAGFTCSFESLSIRFEQINHAEWQIASRAR